MMSACERLSSWSKGPPPSSVAYSGPLSSSADLMISKVSQPSAEAVLTYSL